MSLQFAFFIKAYEIMEKNHIKLGVLVFNYRLLNI